MMVRDVVLVDHVDTGKMMLISIFRSSFDNITAVRIES